MVHASASLLIKSAQRPPSIFVKPGWPARLRRCARRITVSVAWRSDAGHPLRHHLSSLLTPFPSGSASTRSASADQQENDADADNNNTGIYASRGALEASAAPHEIVVQGTVVSVE